MRRGLVLPVDASTEVVASAEVLLLVLPLGASTEVLLGGAEVLLRSAEIQLGGAELPLGGAEVPLLVCCWGSFSSSPK